MLTPINSALALACLFAGTLCAANDPFCGKWKLNPEKSKIAGEQMKIEDLGGNKYRLTSGDRSDTIVADGRTSPFISEGPWPLPQRVPTPGKWS
jgi:hypothetical protein